MAEKEPDSFNKTYSRQNTDDYQELPLKITVSESLWFSYVILERFCLCQVVFFIPINAHSYYDACSIN